MEWKVLAHLMSCGNGVDNPLQQIRQTDFRVGLPPLN